MLKIIEQPRYSCALGVQQTVVAIERAIPILHSGPGCCSKITGIIGQGDGYAGGNSIPCSNISESEVIYGGEEKLRGVINGSFEVMDADLFVVLTGCTSDIVGDDVKRVTGEYQVQGKPIVFVETGGFKSNNYVSHEAVVNAIVDQYVEKYAADKSIIKGLVNVFATLPYQDPFWNGNLEEIKRVLEGIGLKVNVLFGPGSGGVSEWLTVPKAQFNIVLSAWAGLGIVKHLEDKYGTPYLHIPYLPVGGIETSKFLRLVGGFGKIDPGITEDFIQREEKKFYAHIERMADFLLEFKYGLPRKFYSILDASYSIGISKYLLNELGIIPAKQFIIDNTPEEYQALIKEQFRQISEYRSADVFFEINAGAVHEQIRQDNIKNRVLILGSCWESNLAKELKADLLILSVPVTFRLVLDCGYFGYKGGLRIIEDIYDRVLETYR